MTQFSTVGEILQQIPLPAKYSVAKGNDPPPVLYYLTKISDVHSLRRDFLMFDKSGYRQENVLEIGLHDPTNSIMSIELADPELIPKLIVKINAVIDRYEANLLAGLQDN